MCITRSLLYGPLVIIYIIVVGRVSSIKVEPVDEISIFCSDNPVIQAVLDKKYFSLPFEDDNEGDLLPFHIVTLSCRSSLPITWENGGFDAENVTMQSVDMLRTVIMYTKKIKSYCYEATLTLVSRQLKYVHTGWFTCSTISGNLSIRGYEILDYTVIRSDEKTRASSVYFYESENNATQMLSQNTLEIVTLSELNEVTVPFCRNGPGIMVQLEKLDLISSKFLTVSNTTTSTDSDKIRFQQTDDLDGTYKCRGNTGLDLLFIIQKGINESERSADLEIEYLESDICGDITCRSKMERYKPVRMKILPCENPTHCGLLWKANRKYLSSLPSSSVESTCGVRPSGAIICSTECGEKFEYAEYISPPNSSVLLHPIARLTDNAVMIDFEGESVFLGKPIKVTCWAMTHFFSDGIYLLVKFGDNREHPLNTSVVLAASTTKEGGFYVRQWNVTVNSKNITQLICAAPLLYSSEWVFANSRKFDVIMGKSPLKIIFPHGSSPTLMELKLNDTDVIIRCEATGNPAPKIEFFKNGAKLDPNVVPVNYDVPHETLTISGSYVKIPLVKAFRPGVDGRWLCEASNGVDDAASHEIEIYVEGVEEVSAGSRTWIILAALTSALFLSCTGCTYFWNQYWLKRRMRKMRKAFSIPPEEFKKFWYGDQTVMDQVRELANTSGRKIARALRYADEKYELNPDDVTEVESDSPLGKGNFGVVKKGKYKDANGEEIPVAIKSPLMTADPEADRLNKEALLDELKMLIFAGEHPFLIKLIGAVTKTHLDGKIQVLLEFCKSDLETYLKSLWQFTVQIRDDQICFSTNIPLFSVEPARSNYAQLSVKDIPSAKTFDLIRWSFQIACGMQYLMSRRIIHRDLAARNVLIFENTEGNLDVKIADMGISKKLQNRQHEYVKRIGIPGPELPWRYLAPELVQEKNLKFSEDTDVWAYGITLWEIFTLAKEVPYSKYKTMDDAFINGIKHGGLKNPKPEHATSGLYNIMCECWNAEPSRRPAFTALTKTFFELLPVGYRESVSSDVYSPAEAIDVRTIEALHMRSVTNTFEIEESNGQSCESASGRFRSICSMS